MRCKRCGRPLTSELSIKRGYGPTCYQKNKLTDEIDFLKCEVKMLKRLFRQAKFSTTVEPIERVKKVEIRAKLSESPMGAVMEELKDLFLSGRSILVPMEVI
jgi:hypothetical protein